MSDVDIQNTLSDSNRHSDNMHVALDLRQQNFRMFFSGLIFAVISFIGSHPIHTKYLWLKISQVLSLFFLLTAGILLLISLSEIRQQNKPYKYLLKKAWNWLCCAIYNAEKYRWIFFLIGMVIAILNWSVELFLTE